MEEAITGDFALIKAWKADKETFYASSNSFTLSSRFL